MKIEYTFKSLHSVTSLGRYQTNSHHVLHSWVESSCSFYVENKIWVWSNIMAKIEINQNWVQLWNSHVIMLGRYLVIVGYITTAVDINEVRIYMFLFVFLRFFCYEMHNNFCQNTHHNRHTKLFSYLWAS